MKKKHLGAKGYNVPNMGFRAALVWALAPNIYVVLGDEK